MSRTTSPKVIAARRAKAEALHTRTAHRLGILREALPHADDIHLGTLAIHLSDYLFDALHVALHDNRAAVMSKGAATREAATADEIAKARARYADDSDGDIAVDDDANVSRVEQGAWVSGWLWVDTTPEGVDAR